MTKRALYLAGVDLNPGLNFITHLPWIACWFVGSGQSAQVPFCMSESYSSKADVLDKVACLARDCCNSRNLLLYFGARFDFCTRSTSGFL